MLNSDLGRQIKQNAPEEDLNTDQENIVQNSNLSTSVIFTKVMNFVSVFIYLIHIKK